MLFASKFVYISDTKLIFNLNLFFSSSLIYRSDSFRGFVDYCLQKIPQERPSSTDLLRVNFQISFGNLGKMCLPTPK